MGIGENPGAGLIGAHDEAGAFAHFHFLADHPAGATIQAQELLVDVDGDNARPHQLMDEIETTGEGIVGRKGFQHRIAGRLPFGGIRLKQRLNRPSGR